MLSSSATAACWGCAVLFLLSGGPVRAGDEVRVSVLVVLASEDSTEVHPKLECIAREVKKRYPLLTGYRLDHVSCKPIRIGKKVTFDLVGGQTATVAFERSTAKDDRMQMKIRPPRMGEIVYDTACGKFLPIITPFRTRKKELLIMAVSVRPCGCK